MIVIIFRVTDNKLVFFPYDLRCFEGDDASSRITFD